MSVYPPPIDTSLPLPERGLRPAPGTRSALMAYAYRRVCHLERLACWLWRTEAS